MVGAGSGDLTWLTRAVQIIDFAVNVQARANDWHLPEHYDTRWHPDLDYNKDQPAHPFRPYGVTPGHGLEWSRLTVQARAVRLVADPHDSDPVGAEATPEPGTEDPGLAPSDSIDTE